jgi:hypothetical protein
MSYTPTYPHFWSLASFLNLERQIQNPEEYIGKIQYAPTGERFSTV